VKACGINFADVSRGEGLRYQLCRCEYEAWTLSSR
jgi:hypothetical protein